MKIDDIARLANVSKSAVSLALNGKNGVSEKTREKILRIAKEHGYIPRPIVKADQFSQTNNKLLRFVACTNTGIVTNQYKSLPFFMELIHNLENEIGSSGYSLIVSSIGIDNLEEEITKLEQEQQSSGILLLGTNLTAEQIQVFAKIQPNLVVLDTCFETMNVNFIVMNNVYGAYQAGQYLIDLGHKEIGYVGSNLRIYNFDMRKKGFLQAMEENGIIINEEKIYSVSPTIITSQEEFKSQIKNKKEQLPTALFCEADYMAISVIKSLTELGIRVPEDISVIGFDDIFESRVITPELTTIHVKKDKIAFLAVENLIKQIESKETTKIKILVDTDFVERKSCKRVNGL